MGQSVVDNDIIVGSSLKNNKQDKSDDANIGKSKVISQKSAISIGSNLFYFFALSIACLHIWYLTPGVTLLSL